MNTPTHAPSRQRSTRLASLRTRVKGAVGGGLALLGLVVLGACGDPKTSFTAPDEFFRSLGASEGSDILFRINCLGPAQDPHFKGHLRSASGEVRFENGARAPFSVGCHGWGAERLAVVAVPSAAGSWSVWVNLFDQPGDAQPGCLFKGESLPSGALTCWFRDHFTNPNICNERLEEGGAGYDPTAPICHSGVKMSLGRR